MKKETCFYLGIISKTVGLKGSLEFFLDVDDPDKYKNLEQVFVEIDTRLVPYFIKSLQIKKNKAVVLLEDVNDLEKAAALTKKDLYLPLSFLPPLSGNKFYFHEVIGFEVIDEEKGSIGNISGVIENPKQELIQIKVGLKEILIPIHDEFIKSIDRENKIMRVSTPEGLIDLYLKE